MRKSRKQLLTSAVIAIGAADMVGIYVAQHRLAQSVPDDVRSDPSVVAVIDTGVFRPDQGMPAVGAPAAANAPQLAVAEPKAAPAVAVQPAAARPAAAAPARNVELASAGGAPAPVAPLVPLVVKPSRHGAAAGMFGAVDLTGKSAVVPHPLTQRRAHRSNAFSAAFADVALDVPVTQQLDSAYTSPALAADDAVGDLSFANNTAAPSSAAAAANIELPAIVPDSSSSSSGAITLPETGKL